MPAFVQPCGIVQTVDSVDGYSNISNKQTKNVLRIHKQKQMFGFILTRLNDLFAPCRVSRFQRDDLSPQMLR